MGAIATLENVKKRGCITWVGARLMVGLDDLSKFINSMIL